MSHLNGAEPDLVGSGDVFATRVPDAQCVDCGKAVDPEFLAPYDEEEDRVLELEEVPAEKRVFDTEPWCDDCWRAWRQKRMHKRFLGDWRDAPAVQPILSFEHLLELPDPDWLVHGLLPEGFGVLYGAPSAFKSFLALDWALSVATGRPWHGHEVGAPSDVIYVAAEGRGGLKKRAVAWWEANGKPDMGRVHFLPEPVDLLEANAQVGLAGAIHVISHNCGPVKMLVVDTMARCMVGGDENSAREVGQFIQALDGFNVSTKLVVHHTGKAGGEGGSSALRGAADVMVRVEREPKAPVADVICDKAKDFDAWPTMTLERELAGDPLVLKPTSAFDAKAKAADERCEAVLAFVREHGPVSQAQVEKGVSGKAVALRLALEELQAKGAVRLNKQGQTKLYDVPRPTIGDAAGTG
jgi:hypothetical protein